MTNPSLTVLIPTHAVKTELIGPYKNNPQHNATAPSTRLIEAAISSINTNLDIDKQFLIGLDHKSDQDISNAYLNNLNLLKEKYNHVDVTHVSHTASENVLTTYSATENFFNLIDTVFVDGLVIVFLTLILFQLVSTNSS